MSGKRSDQHNIDPREADATDDKTLTDDELREQRERKATKPDDERDRVDEASDESFPASDPPAY